ncbi:MAG: decarboxylating 6-phosphogluconate dehydrogenase [Deltaproteobacteria bacterium]|nr:decarboxylating 6-phosphogluconate dehydrogenase [Deltaproteobacteria bacterium]
MQLGFIGLGRMGGNMVRRLLQGGHQIIAYNRSPEPTREVEKLGATAAFSIEELVKKLPAPRTVWVMVPSGKATTDNINTLAGLLSAGDTVIEGGNSHYKDDVANAAMLKQKGIHYLDAGTSGGIWGLKIGYCMMVGGDREVFNKHEPIFKTLAPENGYGYMGGHGSGHYVKMIHNGIEYGMMQAYAEGFELMQKSDFKLDLPFIANMWMQGSVVRSWLLDLAASALSKDPQLAKIQGYVEDSGEGRWTILDAIEKDVPAPVITQSLYTRFRSRQAESFGEKVLAALRNEFGGHAVKAK